MSWRVGCNFGWQGGGGGGTLTGAENGIYVSGTVVRLGTNPLIEETTIEQDGWDFLIANGGNPIVFYNAGNDRVGVHTITPSYGTHAVGTDLTSATIAQSIFTDNTTLAPTYRTLFARGTEATPVDTPNTSVIGQHYYSAIVAG